MIGEELVLTLKDDKAYFVEDKIMSIANLFPNFKHWRFTITAYWTIRVLQYNDRSGHILAKILCYQKGQMPVSQNASLNLSSINSIDFNHVDERGFLGSTDNKDEVWVYTPGKNDKYYKSNQRTRIQETEETEKIPIKSVLKESVVIPITKVGFKNGYVEFEVKVKGIRYLQKFTIENSTIREEFDAIKNYFANKLQTKKIEVQVEVEITDGTVTNRSASSLTISKIDGELVEAVKFDVLDFVRSKVSQKTEKAIFTREELLQLITDKKTTDSFLYNDDNKIIEDLINVSNSKHYRQLRWLSSKHNHNVMKVRFVLTPFSFIFLLCKEEKYHILWETLNTEEATYVWHIEKNVSKLKDTLSIIEGIINEMRIHGKKGYIKSSTDDYNRIYHDYTLVEEGFAKWRHDLENCL